MPEINVPSVIAASGGAHRQAGTQAVRLGARRALLVTDREVRRLGYAGEVAASLEAAGVSCELFDAVEADPSVANVLAGLEAFRAAQADLLVAVGGGSPIDTAKAISCLTVNPGPLSAYAGYHKVPKAGPPVIAIPTTAGTGAEATKIAVITDQATNVKMMILDAALLPRVALVDYEFSRSMPPALTAAVGIDTLTHGIEAYVSRKSKPLTDVWALSCIGRVAGALRRAFAEGADRAAREAMSLAALEGGMAFSNSSVCLVHGMSRPLGAVYHMAHGLSNAVLLPAVTRFSWPASPARYATVARTLGCARANDPDEAACRKLVDWLQSFNEELAVPRLRDCVGVGHESFTAAADKLAADAIASGSPANNPRLATANEIIELYLSAW